MSTLSQFFGGGGTLKHQEFLSSGTFTAPVAGTYWVTMIGGGGGGGARIDSASNTVTGGYAGQCLVRFPVVLTAAQAVTVTIGSGGAGASRSTSGSTTGSTGGNTSFDSLVVNGGKGGALTTTAPHTAFTAAESGSCSPGERHPVSGFGPATNVINGAGGLFSHGTVGSPVAGTVANAPSNSGAGGGGVYASSPPAVGSITGGAGGSGRVIVEWFE